MAIETRRAAALLQRPFSMGWRKERPARKIATRFRSQADSVAATAVEFQMPRYVMLNNVAHKDLRVITRYGAELGDDIGTALTFPTEFAEIQKEYPIFFRRERESGEYHAVALLGFEKNENLFLEGQRWNAAYLPAVIARGPFLIGFQEQQIDGEIRSEPVIHVDLDHPRVSQVEGESVFLPQGGNSPYLDHIAAVLRDIRDGLEIGKAMFAAFTAMELIEPVKVEIKLNEQEAYGLTGLYTVGPEKLQALDAGSLYTLNQAGFLQLAFLILASHGNVRKLMAMKQRRRQMAGSR
jgi:SapC